MNSYNTPLKKLAEDNPSEFELDYFDDRVCNKGGEEPPPLTVVP
jgi:hypothetical protein